MTNIQYNNQYTVPSFQGLNISPVLRNKVGTWTIQFFDDTCHASKKLKDIHDFDVNIGDNFQISVQKVVPNKSLFKQFISFISGKKQQKPYDFFAQLKYEMNNSGKENGIHATNERYPDIPNLLTNLWENIEANINPETKYEEFKKLSDLSQATELAILLSKNAGKSLEHVDTQIL